MFQLQLQGGPRETWRHEWSLSSVWQRGVPCQHSWVSSDQHSHHQAEGKPSHQSVTVSRSSISVCLATTHACVRDSNLTPEFTRNPLYIEHHHTIMITKNSNTVLIKLMNCLFSSFCLHLWFRQNSWAVVKLSTLMQHNSSSNWHAFKWVSIAVAQHQFPYCIAHVCSSPRVCYNFPSLFPFIS